MARLRRFLLVVFLTILTYRVSTYIIIFFWGRTPWWHGVYTDKWNHYQLGAILVFLGFLPIFKSYKNFKKLMIAVGTGMIIDEVTDVIKLFHLYPLPPDFRDSLPDLGLIVVTYAVFAASCFAYYKLKKNSSD